MEAERKKLQTKTKFLKFLADDTEKIVKQSDPAAMERHLNTIQTKLAEVQDLKVNIQEMKFEEGANEDEIRKWTSEIDESLTNFAGIESELREMVKEIKRVETEKEQREKEQRRHNIEKEFEKERFEQKYNHEKKLEELHEKISSKQPESKVKLPKLEITKFKGTHMDWFRFWNQYEVEIDKADISPVTKFSYLKELVIPTVRVAIDGLPLTVEGYERAQQILKAKYGKSSEVVNSYIQSIMSLPQIRGSHAVTKVHDFYAKLGPSVQALESLGKLKDIKGYARLTLDKLEGIRADLTRVDDDWQEWGFSQLLEALRKWTERNPLPTENKSGNQDDKEQGPGKNSKRDNLLQAQQQWKHRPCVYCETNDHKSSDCTKVAHIVDRKRILTAKALCFNCTG